MKNILFAASGEGTTVQAFLDQREAGTFTVPILGLISNICEEECGAIRRVMKAGLPTKSVIRHAGEKRTAYDQRFVEAAKELGADPEQTVLVLAGYMRRLSEWLIDAWKAGALNTHPSLLPKHAGLMDRQVHEAVIAAREVLAGMTVHRAGKVVDGGPILEQQQCVVFYDHPVRGTDTPDSVRSRVQSMERRFYPTVVQELYDGTREMPPL